MTETERLHKYWDERHALNAIDNALNFVGRLNLPAAVWDLQAARRRVEEAREKSNDA